jgi:dTDP-glucose 4,6-dehydratase
LACILVTGGLGFIGSNFIRHILGETVDSPRILNLDSMSYGANPQNLSDMKDSPHYRFVKGPITDLEKVRDLLSQVDAVVHFAAETHVDRSIKNPESFLQTNVFGTFTLLEAARKSKLKKFVHISTDEVYGTAPTGVSFKEVDRVHPSSPYAASKAASDMLVEAYHTTYGLGTVILRCTNNFGPRQFPEKLIPKAIINSLLGRRIPLYGTGQQIRDWMYVLDFCRAIKLALEKATPGSVYNVSAGNELPNIEIANHVVRALDKPRDLIRFVEDRPGHDYRYSLDSNKIRKDIGWAPSYNFQEALKETIDWYTKNEDWWKPLISDKVLSATPWKENW